ncbi:MAG TPA: Mur ligase family protein [Acidimicrobiales bacterium]|nr:Mur ligase family protein [Acidimicrobiales bacterium]
MRRPAGFADLAGRRVGVYGFGVEGRAAAERLRVVGADVVVVDDGEVTGAIPSAEGGHDALLACEVVLKSPGVPRRRSDVLDLEASGVVVTSALNLWLHDVDRARVVAVTGTKGKSTTTSLVTFFLSALGEAAQSLGNIGQPPYATDVDDQSGWLVVEVSSFQVVDLDVGPATVVVTALGSDHLDWHGSLAQYHEDKLSLAALPGVQRVYGADVPGLRAVADRLNHPTFVGADDGALTDALGLIGDHNRSNVGLALAVAADLARRPVEEARAVIGPAAGLFHPLPGRLTVVAREATTEGEVTFVDDGLATSPLPAVAALAVFADRPVALIAGGFDRGVDYEPLADALAERSEPTTLVATGDAGRRLSEVVALRAPRVARTTAASMAEAVARARSALGADGVVLLSPAAPSFDAYRNWEERSADFRSVVAARPA